MALYKLLKLAEIVGKMHSHHHVFYISYFEYLDIQTSSEKVKYMLALCLDLPCLHKHQIQTVLLQHS